jgi:1,4-dihydroxy-2-naphthoyl-CoA hydrolase
MFTHHTRIYLHHTDAAGRLFFANQFYLIYEAKEMFFETLGLSVEAMLNDPQLTFPLVHAESDFKGMLITGDEVDITVKVEKIGNTSVTFAYTIMKKDVLVGTAKTVSVVVDKRTQQKQPVPAHWRAKLQKGM